MPTTDELRALIMSNLPDNVTGEIDAKDMRDLLRYIADIVDALVTGNLKGYASRQAAVDALPISAGSGGGRIITIEGDTLVVRGAGHQTVDPLTPSAPYWGVVFRLPGRSLVEAISNLGDVIALQTDTEASTGQRVITTIPASQAHMTLYAGQQLRLRWPFSNTGADPIISIDGVDFIVQARNGGTLSAGDLPGGQRLTGYVYWNSDDLKIIRLSESVKASDINGLKGTLELGSTIPLTNLGGTENAITADLAGSAVATGVASTANLSVRYIPTLSNTNDSQTDVVLHVSGDEPRIVRTEDGARLPAGYFAVGRAYTLYRRGAEWRVATGAVGWADMERKQEAIDSIEVIAHRADDRASVVLQADVDGVPSNNDYPVSFGNKTGMIFGLHELRRILDFGFPISSGGPGSPYVTGEDAKYLVSMQGENRVPFFAIELKSDGEIVIHGKISTPGASTAGVDVEGFAAKRAANEMPVLNDDDQTRLEPFTTAREVYIGVPFRGAAYSSGEAGAGVDVGWLPPNGEVNIELNHDGAYIYSRAGFGGVAHNTLERTPGVYTVVRVFRLGPKYLYQVVIGSVVTSNTAPIRASSLATGGQSHIQGGFFQGVIAGLLDGLANVQWRPGNWMPAPIHWTPHCINGATGETAISSASKPPGSSSYWWHRVDQTDGPALTTWKTRISDAVTAGQPVPEDVIWAQGEGDTESTAAGTLPLADLWTDTVALFTEMRAFLIGLGATDPQFYIGMLGRGEGTGLKAKAQGYTAVRQNYLRLIAETAWVHYACELYDLPGAFNDIHYGFLGHYTHGYRYSRAIANVRHGQNNSLGPQVISAALEDGGRSVRLTITGTDLRMPSNPAPPWIIPADGDAQSTPVPVTRVRTDGNDLVVSAAQDLTGCRLIYPSGAVINPRGDSIVYDLAHSHVQMPGLPLRSFITNPLA